MKTETENKLEISWKRQEMKLPNQVRIFRITNTHGHAHTYMEQHVNVVSKFFVNEKFINP